MELSQFNATNRFTGLADLYARFRPGYPAAALDFICSHCGLGPSSLLVDVGCGTGISTRLFAGRGLRVIGVEPNAEMRAQAEAEPPPPGAPPPQYVPGRAEATHLSTSIANVVLAAQAFHWFEPVSTLREFYRLLKPGGWVVLLWNEREEADPATAAYGAVIRTAPDAATVEGPRAQAGTALLSSPLFVAGQRVVFSQAQVLSEEALLGRAFSASYAPAPPGPAELFAKALREVFARFQQAGTMTLRYQTAVYLAPRGQ